MIRLLLISMLSLGYFYGASSCSCGFSFPPEEFCKAEFVIKFKVKDITEMKNESLTVFQVDILETYKASDEAKAALKLGLLKTYLGYPGSCSLKFYKDQVHAFGGYIINGQPNINYCGLKIYNFGNYAEDENNVRKNYPEFCNMHKRL